MIPPFRAYLANDELVDVFSITWYGPDFVVLRWKDGSQERYCINDFELVVDVLQDAEPADTGDIDEEW